MLSSSPEIVEAPVPSASGRQRLYFSCWPEGVVRSKITCTPPSGSVTMPGDCSASAELDSTVSRGDGPPIAGRRW